MNVDEGIRRIGIIVALVAGLTAGGMTLFITQEVFLPKAPSVAVRDMLWKDYGYGHSIDVATYENMLLWLQDVQTTVSSAKALDNARIRKSVLDAILHGASQDYINRYLVREGVSAEEVGLKPNKSTTQDNNTQGGVYSEEEFANLKPSPCTQFLSPDTFKTFILSTPMNIHQATPPSLAGDENAVAHTKVINAVTEKLRPIYAACLISSNGTNTGLPNPLNANLINANVVQYAQAVKEYSLAGKITGWVKVIASALAAALAGFVVCYAAFKVLRWVLSGFAKA